MFPQKKKLLFWISTFFFLIFFTLGLLSLREYGPNWDEAVHFARGQAFLQYFLTGKKNYDDISPKTRKSYYENSLNFNFFVAPERAGHPPLSDILASFSNYIFYQKLNVLGDIESYHLYSLFLAAVLVGFVFYFTASNYSIFAGIVAALSLSLYPLFVGESRFNIKDVPEAAFLSFSIILFYYSVLSNSAKKLFLSALFFGCAFATKLNIVFFPIIVAPWALVYYTSIYKKEKPSIFLKKKLIFLFWLLSYPFLAILLFFVPWPFLWSSPITRFLAVLKYYKTIGTNSGFDPRYLTFFGINNYAIQWILYTTPLIVLFLSSLGFVYFLKRGIKEKSKTTFLIILWFLIPVLRVTMPGAGIYGGVRQIMEYIPAMAILSGIGAMFLSQQIRQKFDIKNTYSQRIRFSIILLFIPIILKIISLYPNESIFFNSLIGGLQGAKKQNIPGWGNSLGSTYRQGAAWLNEHAKPNSKLALIYELRSNVADIDLRPDILYFNQYRSGLQRKGEYLMGVTHEGVSDNTYSREYAERFLNPVFQVKVDDVPVLKVWENDIEHTKPGYLKDPVPVLDPLIEKDDKDITVDLKKEFKITQIELNYVSGNCTIPSSGYFIISKDKRNWIRLKGDFTTFYFNASFVTQPREGVLDFLFAADQVRYIRAVILDENSCLLNNTKSVTVWHI